MSTTFTLPSASAALFSKTWHYDDDHDDDAGDNGHNDQNDYLCKFQFVLLDLVPVHIAQLSVLTDLVWWPDRPNFEDAKTKFELGYGPRADWLAVDVDIWLLPHVHPDDLPILGVDRPTHLK